MAKAPAGSARRRERHGSLQLLFVGIALVIILPFALLIAYFGYSQIAQEKNRVQDAALVQARTLAAQVETQLTARVEGLVATAEAVGAGVGTPGTAEAQIRRLRQGFPDVIQVVVLDQVGTVVASAGAVPEGRRANLADQTWFRRAATATAPFPGPPRQEGPDILIGLYAPVRTGDGQFRGVVAAELSLKRIQEVLVRAPLRPSAAAELVTPQGLVVARQDGRFLMRDVKDQTGYREFLSRPDGVSEFLFEDQERRLAGAAAVRPLGFIVIVGFSSAQALADVKALITQVGGSAAVAAIMGLALAAWLGRRTASGMARLRAAMGRLEGGDIPASIPLTIGGEVGHLTDGFNRMLVWLRSRLQEYEAVSRVDEAAGAAIGGERSLDAVLPNLLRRIVSGMSADAGAIVTHEEEGLVTKAAVGFGVTQTEGVTMRRGQGLAGAVVAGREPVIVEDVDADYRVEEPYIKTVGIRSVIGVPIVSLDRVIGAVEICYRSPHAFSEAEIQRLEAMARRAAQALEHERALGEVRRNTADLQTRLAEQMEALQRAAMDQAETRRQAQEAKRETQELERTMKLQVAPARPDPAAEEAKRVRAALQKTVSEELRAPLTALLELPRFLVDGLDHPLEPAEQQQLEILHSGGEEILELIDNLVLLSSLHAGQLKVAKGSVSVPELVQRVARGLAPRAATRGDRIETDIKPNVGQVMTDGRRLEQALWNLLVTSIKFTEVGEIRVTCYMREPDIVITVADDGVGFSDEEQERLFEPFLQVAPRDGRPMPGTGLLLTVAQRLVQLLGGKIRVESEVDRGTWFTVSLPAQS